MELCFVIAIDRKTDKEIKRKIVELHTALEYVETFFNEGYKVIID